MKKATKIIAAIAGLVMLGGALTACTEPASDTVSRNLSTEADNFEVQRKIVILGGINGNVIGYAEGRCSVERGDRSIVLTCKHSAEDYRKHIFMVGDQDSVAVTQEEPIDVSEYHTKIVLRPQTLLPEFDIVMGETP